ncbi:alpha/beta hydrolase [Carboxylicivirga sp. RSCT41]|uniref:alpha/beta hydrolase n=1 Tax=Carboxylicivirga agarovorans TaxID=3417570 RepID=UPI003D341C21
MKRAGKYLAIVLISMFTLVVQSQNSYYNPEIPEIVQYTVTPDVKYGEGKIMSDNKIGSKDLNMDVYYPTNNNNNRPAVILSYGGSFHRGNPRIPYAGFGGQTTTMSQYAMRLAAEGYVVFTINYRVAPDNPVLDNYEGFSEDDLDADIFKSQMAIDQTNTIRQQMGLDNLTDENAEKVLKTAVLAATEDLRKAIRHIKTEHEIYNIDPDKIALGGFSAGGVISINVAYALQEEVSAVFTNSGFPAVFKMEKLLPQSDKHPPILIFISENDYPVVKALMPPFMQELKAIGVETNFNWVSGFGHFYPSGAVSLSDTGDKMPIEQRIIQFLDNKLK